MAARPFSILGSRPAWAIVSKRLRTEVVVNRVSLKDNINAKHYFNLGWFWQFRLVPFSPFLAPNSAFASQMAWIGLLFLFFLQIFPKSYAAVCFEPTPAELHQTNTSRMLYRLSYSAPACWWIKGALSLVTCWSVASPYRRKRMKLKKHWQWFAKKEAMAKSWNLMCLTKQK